ncbi:hypothetical protein D6D08_03931 [Aureobasidium pullulans]|nr:hypothetical protein D6D08_03931 [Aureobasidium pullulans]
MARHLWLLSTHSAANITPLHRQSLRGRKIVVMEDPGLHLVWRHDCIYIKPVPKYLLSHVFWNDFLMVEPTAMPSDRCKIVAAALGFLRSYFYLIQHESDLRIAQREQLQLVPKTVTWEKFCSFSDSFGAISDDEVSERYQYGELRLTRLNLWGSGGGFQLRPWHPNGRKETEADEIRVRDPVVFNSAGRISNAELLRAIVQEFNKAQAEQDAKYNVAIQEIQDVHTHQVEVISQTLARSYQEVARKAYEEHQKEVEKNSERHQDETKKITQKHQEEIKKTIEKHQSEHQNVSKQVQELRKQLEDSKIREMGDAMRRVEEQLTQMSIAGSASPTTTASISAATQPRQTWSQVASQKGPSVQHSARTELLSDSEASHNAQPLANEGKTMEIDISRARGDKDDLNRVKDKWIKALQENPNTEDVEVEFLREIYTNKVELCLATVVQAQRTRDNPRWIEKAMPGARIRGEAWFPIKCRPIV